MLDTFKNTSSIQTIWITTITLRGRYHSRWGKGTVNAFSYCWSGAHSTLSVKIRICTLGAESMLKNSKWFLKLNPYRVSCTETRRKMSISISKKLKWEVKDMDEGWRLVKNTGLMHDPAFEPKSYWWTWELRQIQKIEYVAWFTLHSKLSMIDVQRETYRVLFGPAINFEFWAWKGTEVPSVISSWHYLIALIFLARNVASATAHLPKCPQIFSRIKFQRKL